MKEANIKINAHTAEAEANLARLAGQSDETAQKVMGISETAFTVAETMTGAFAVATGALGLFGGENEKFQKIASKANSAIALAIGVRQLAEQKANIASLEGTAIFKAKAVAMKVATVAQTLFSFAVAGSSKAF